jgi:hypothetical protein
MTRKDYVRFAAMLKVLKYAADSLSTNDAWIRNRALDDFRHATADIFEQDNERFDRARFLKACGVES